MRGFSLVELSIVLVILGLLTGGILAGQSLIRAAEIRSVTTEYQRYMTALRAFQDKYAAAPGDMKDATRFWLRQSGSSDCVSNSGTAVGTPGTCDGNGDNSILGATTANASGEMFQFWRQLALAGLIEGSYSGLSGTNTGSFTGIDGVIGVNVPASRLSNAGWGVMQLNTYGGDAATPAYDYGNHFLFGNKNSGNYLPSHPALRPVEAWNIDTKIDDGNPIAGRFIAVYWDPCTTAASATATSSSYQLDNNDIACAFRIAKIL